MRLRLSIRPIVALFALSALCVIVAAQQGCYRHIVGARGLGASTYDVSQPYQENSKVDDWVFGQKPTNDKIIRTKPQE